MDGCDQLEVDYYFQDELRWTFGFDNPNKGAAVIVTLLPLLWIVAGGFSRFRNRALKWGGIFLGLVLVCAGWWLLFKTYSRGGIAAGGAAFVYIAVCYTSALLKNWLPIVTGMIVVAALFISTQAANRSVEWIGSHEGSVENRFALWKGGLEMLAENPQGVGRGKSGEAYMQWYQPLDATTGYRTLVNSYLTFATEQGMWIFGAAVFLAALSWSGTVPGRKAGFTRDAAIGARASLVAFAVAGFFSTTMEEAKLWMVPAACAAVLVALALRKPEWKKWGFSFGKVAMSTLALCAVLYVAGLLFARTESVRIALRGGSGNQTVLIVPKNAGGGGIRDCLCVMPDKGVMGTDYGKLLRHLAETSHLRVHVSNSVDFSQQDMIILVSGEGVNRLAGLKGRQLVLLAPAKMEDPQAAAILRDAKSVKLLLPSFDEDGRVAFWKDAAENAQRPGAITTETLAGVGTEIEWAWETIVQRCGSGG